MRIHSISLLPLIISPAISDAYWGFFQQGETAKLFGNSFGLLGKDATYDYVASTYHDTTKNKADRPQIVGGGTSGVAVAKRLAENPAISVAVIEAGGFCELNNGNVSQIPAFHTVNSNSDPDPANIQPLIDWGVITTAQAVGTSVYESGNHFSLKLGSE